MAHLCWLRHLKVISIHKTVNCARCNEEMQWEGLYAFYLKDRRQLQELYYHPKCYLKSKYWNTYHLPLTSASLSGLYDLPKQDQTNIMKLLWPNQLPITIRAKAKLPKFMDEMSIKELRLEVEKRDINQHRMNRKWNDEQIKQELRARLEQYLNNGECKKVNRKMVFGYCKEIQRQNDLNIPIYLQQIVLKYFPPAL